MGWPSKLFIRAFILLLVGFLVWIQVETARVMLFGVPTYGVIESEPRCSRYSTSLTIAFTDLRGHRHTVHHTTAFFCYSQYHAGDDVRLRYVPSDPQNLLTQPEINDLPIELIFPFGLSDVIFLGGGALWFAMLLSEIAPGLAPWPFAPSRRRAVAPIGARPDSDAR